MLKLAENKRLKKIIESAAFGRLCVETKIKLTNSVMYARQPPSGGCVLKPIRGYRHK